MLAMFIRHSTFIFSDPSMPLYHFATDIVNPLFHFSFPMFAIFTIEGMSRTKHMRRNMLLLVAFGIITEPLFDLYFGGSLFYLGHQNILWTYLAYDLFYLAFLKIKPNETDILFNKVMRYVILVVLAGIMICVAEITNIDYGGIGLFGMILAYFIYKRTNNLPIAMLAIVVLEILCTGSFFWLIGEIFIILYNPNKKCSHTKVQKYAGYAFYPVHIGFLEVISLLVH